MEALTSACMNAYVTCGCLPDTGPAAQEEREKGIKSFVVRLEDVQKKFEKKFENEFERGGEPPLDFAKKEFTKISKKAEALLINQYYREITKR